MANQQLRVGDVVVVIPGILGSVLLKDGKDVWATSLAAIVRGVLHRGREVRALELNGDDPDERDLGDGVTADRLVSDLRVAPGLNAVDGYSGLHRMLLAQPGVAWGENYFHLPYDWRRDNRVAARKLESLSHTWLERWRERSGNQDAKLILIGHSMGGLVARYFLECLQGWRSTRMLITFGTPFRGSLNAVDFLANGMRKGIWPLKLDLTDVLRSLTSVYQLLPTYSCCDGGNGALVELGTTAMRGVDSARVKEAREFHAAIERAARDNEREPAYGRTGYLRPIVGYRQPTLQSVRITRERIETLRELAGTDRGGDGTVPWDSAQPLDSQGEPVASVYGAQRHASMQNAPSLHEHLGGLLTEPRPVIRDVTREIALELDEEHTADAPVQVAARIPNPSQGAQPPLRALVTSAERPRPIAEAVLKPGADGRHTGQVGPLEPGIYRMSVKSPGMESVHDVFAVFAATQP
jgi:hypothetical protein